MAEGTEESLSAPGFTHLEVLKEIFLMFQQQFSGGFQKFPSLCDPQGGAPSVPQHSWVCEVQLGPPGNIWRWCVESQDLPKIHLQTLFFYPPYLITLQLDQWWPYTCQDALSEVISLHSGKRKFIKGWAWHLPCRAAVLGDGSSGGLLVQPRCVPLNWGPGESPAAPSSAPSLIFIILKAV